MAETENEVSHLVTKGVNIRWQHLIYFINNTVQLYKEDCTILRIFWAV